MVSQGLAGLQCEAQGLVLRLDCSILYATFNGLLSTVSWLPLAVGAASGIGEGTLKHLNQHIFKPRVYITGIYATLPSWVRNLQEHVVSGFRSQRRPFRASGNPNQTSYSSGTSMKHAVKSKDWKQSSHFFRTLKKSPKPHLPKAAKVACLFLTVPTHANPST